MIFLKIFAYKNLRRRSEIYTALRKSIFHNLIIVIKPLLPKDFSLNELQALVSSGETRSEEWRRLQLKRIKEIIENHQSEIIEALKVDLGKPETEGLFELLALIQELRVTELNLSRWMRSKKINIPLSLQPGNAKVKPEPLGCVLIIGAWNYPFMLTIHPLISAFAAGNTAVLKPSEFSPATSGLILKLFSKYFPKNVLRVLEGDGELSQTLVNQNFDHIFFTGGSETGAKVMQAAAKNLVPVTLELGGSNPAIVMPGSDVEITARRLIWGKGLNAGQTCLAPNYLLVEKSLKVPLIESMKKHINSFYGINPVESNQIGKINSRQFQRLKKIIDNAKKNKQIIFGGEIKESVQKISPTLVNVDSMDDPIIKEELFGPILPILSVSDFKSALSSISNKEKPLAIYMFGGSNEEQQELLTKTSSGGVCFNDVILHAGIPEMPFGGVGGSGMGRYHGQSGFENFSHQKAIFSKPFWLDVQFRYPPYKIDISMLKKLFR